MEQRLDSLNGILPINELGKHNKMTEMSNHSPDLKRETLPLEEEDVSYYNRPGLTRGNRDYASRDGP
jgi:hypothetical protein